MILRGFDEFAFAQRQHGTTHDTRHRGRVGDAKREDDAVLVCTEHREQTKRQENARKGKQRIVDRHDDAIDPAAGIAADADRSVCRQTTAKQTVRHADPDAGAGADHDAAQQRRGRTRRFRASAAPLGARQPGREAQLHRIVRRPEQADGSDDEQQGNQDAADDAVESEAFSFCHHPRIEEGIEQVDDQIDQHIGEARRAAGSPE